MVQIKRTNAWVKVEEKSIKKSIQFRKKMQIIYPETKVEEHKHEKQQRTTEKNIMVKR